jgi:aminopeptidase
MRRRSDYSALRGCRETKRLQISRRRPYLWATSRRQDSEPMNIHSEISSSVDPVRLEKLAEVAVKIGLQLQRDQDLVMTAPTRRSAASCAASSSTPIWQVRVIVTTDSISDEETTLARYRARTRTQASTRPRAGSMKAWRRPSRQWCCAARHRAATTRCCLPAQDPGQGCARQQGELDGLQAGAGEDHRLRHQLEHRRLSQPMHGLDKLFPRRAGGGRGEKLADAIFSASRGGCRTIRSPQLEGAQCRAGRSARAG